MTNNFYKQLRDKKRILKKEFNENPCSICFWISKKRKNYCLLKREDSNIVCDCFTLIPKHSELLDKIKIHFGLNNNDNEFILLPNKKFKEYIELENEEKFAKCCIIAQCEPRRDLLSRIKDLQPFKERMFDIIYTNTNTSNSFQEKHYQGFFKSVDQHIRRLEKILYNYSTYARTKILLASAIHLSFRNILSIKNKTPIRELFEVSNSSINRIIEIYDLNFK
jgi:hypothetical protein